MSALFILSSCGDADKKNPGGEEGNANIVDADSDSTDAGTETDDSADPKSDDGQEDEIDDEIVDSVDDEVENKVDEEITDETKDETVPDDDVVTDPLPSQQGVSFTSGSGILFSNSYKMKVQVGTIPVKTMKSKSFRMMINIGKGGKK